MNNALWLRLLWKEYRAVRAFWVALVLLALGLQGLMILYSEDASWRLLAIFNVALAAPAFFALGCAGTAWAIEREDDTYEWLRASPVGEWQVLGSKLALAVAATIAMYAVLWLAALWEAGGRLPPIAELRGMLGLWVLAAAEAIAWGTFFSLRTRGPLAATCLALFATAFIVHFSAWAMREPGAYEFSFADYLAAAPWRIAIVLAVLAADVYLGLRWLHGNSDEVASRGWFRLTRKTAQTATPSPQALVGELRSRPYRGAMLGRLFWQQWRQSGRTLTLLAAVALSVPVALVVIRRPDAAPLVPLTLMTVALLAGSFAFLPDQERRNYRFFQEHNVSPRLVWFSRQLPWMTMLGVTAIIAGILTVQVLWTVVRDVDSYAQRWQSGQWSQYDSAKATAVLAMLPLWIITTYASGQFCSMLLRSGLLSLVAGTVLAGVLCGWIFIVLAMMHLNWLWAAAPIPLVLLAATWLRAPDWMDENHTWSARFRLLASTLLPAVILYTAVAAYRVLQVPEVEWGPHAARYWTLTSEAEQQLDLFRRASDAYVGLARLPEGLARLPDDENGEDPAGDAVEPEGPRPEITPAEGRWLAENADTIALLKQTAARPPARLYDPYAAPLTVTDRLPDFLWLLKYEAHRLESQGQLDEALDIYFVALRVSVSLATPWGPWHTPGQYAQRVLSELPSWAAHPDQTPERIRSAIERLEAFGPQSLQPEAWLEASHILNRLSVEGNEQAQAYFPAARLTPTQASLIHTFLPWEEHRTLRMVRILANSSQERLDLVQQALKEGKPAVEFLPTGQNPANYFLADSDDAGSPQARELVEMFETTFLLPWSSGNTGDVLISNLVKFEAQRRATLIILALNAYRLAHGGLPDSLDALVGDYFDELPLDPYSGLAFAYFPQGLPEPGDEGERVASEQLLEAVARYGDSRDATLLRAGNPALWSPGLLVLAKASPSEQSREDSQAMPGEQVDYFDRLSGPIAPLHGYDAWRRGTWYPIPPSSP